MTDQPPLSALMAEDAQRRAVAPAENSDIRMRELARRIVRAADELQKAELEYNDAKAALVQLTEHEAPDLMMELGTDSYGLPEIASDLECSTVYRGSLPSAEKRPEDRARALEWFVNNEHGDLIKLQVTMLFGRGERDKVTGMLEQLQVLLEFLELKTEVQVEESIHHKTYAAFLREQIEKGQVLPLDTLNAYVGRVAKIVRRKGK